MRMTPCPGEHLLQNAKWCKWQGYMLLYYDKRYNPQSMMPPTPLHVWETKIMHIIEWFSRIQNKYLSIHWAIRRLTAKSSEFLKPWNSSLKLSNRSKIIRAPQYQWHWGTYEFQNDATVLPQNVADSPNLAASGLYEILRKKYYRLMNSGPNYTQINVSTAKL